MTLLRILTIPALTAVLFCGAAPFARAQSSGDQAAVRQMWSAFEALYHSGDSKGIGLMYTESADRRNGRGVTAKGRGQVQAMYEDIFRGRPSRQEPDDSRTRFEYEVRFLRPDVALIDGFFTLPDCSRGPFTVVATRENDVWMMAAGRSGAVLD